MLFAAVRVSLAGTREKRSAPQRLVRYVRYFCRVDEATAMPLDDPHQTLYPLI